MIPTNNQKSLEEVIKNLHAKYKNVPSPLSEEYNRSNSNIHFVPTHKTEENFHNKLIGDFKPSGTRFGSPL